MLRVLAGSIREYKKPSLLAPLLVTGEVVLRTYRKEMQK